MGGSLFLVLTPDELLARLATLVPPPRIHGVRYHGVFAPNAKARARVVPQPLEPPSPAAPTPADASASSSTPGQDSAFREFGLPRIMRTDNGIPFAARSLWGLT